MKQAEKYCIRQIFIDSYQQLEIYLLRQSCPLTSIPRLRILRKQGNTLTLEVQQCPDRMTQYLRVLKNQNQAMVLLDAALSTCSFLIQKFGCFAISSQHLRISEENKLKMWIHQDPAINFPQLPLNSGTSGEKAMIKSLLAVFKPNLTCYQKLVKIDNLNDLQKAVWSNLLKNGPSQDDYQRQQNSLLAQSNENLVNFIKSCPQINQERTLERDAWHGKELKKTIKKFCPSASNLKDFFQKPQVNHYRSAKNLSTNNFNFYLKSTQKICSIKTPKAKAIHMHQNSGVSYFQSNKGANLLTECPKLITKVQRSPRKNIREETNFNCRANNEKEVWQITKSKMITPLQNPDSKISLKSRKTTATLQSQLNQLFSDQQSQQQRLYQQIERQINKFF